MTDTNWQLTMHLDEPTMKDTRVRTELTRLGTLLRGADQTEWNNTLTTYTTGPLILSVAASALANNPAFIQGLQQMGTSVLRGEARDRLNHELGEQFASHGMGSMLSQTSQTSQTGGARSTPGGETSR
jgi:hypothetical protein